MKHNSHSKQQIIAILLQNCLCYKRGLTQRKAYRYSAIYYNGPMK